MNKCFLVIVTSFALAFLGCGDGGTGPSGDTYKVSGTLTKIGVEDGVLGYVGLAEMGSDTSFVVVYLGTSDPFDGGEATYSISGVEEDSYRFSALIDVNSNFNPEDPKPDEGDWETGVTEITVNQNVVLNVPDDDWELCVW